MQNKKMFVDFSHYLAQLIWICSNLTWAGVELFSNTNDDPKGYNQLVRPNGRLVAGFILLMAFIPIIFLYLVWLPMTILNKIKNKENNDGHTRLDVEMQVINALHSND